MVGQFTRFLEYLGRFIIPRLSIRIEPARVSEPQEYLQTIQSEHRAIAAGAAMRDHLVNGRERYRRLVLGTRDGKAWTRS